MKLALVFLIGLCLLGSCLPEPIAKADPEPKALPQGAVGDLLSGLSTLLQNLLAALLGGGMASMMGMLGGGDDSGSDCCGGCDSCSCGCCIQTCFRGGYPFYG